MKSNVFTYGSLMFRPVWKRVVEGRYDLARASIFGFERRFVKDQPYPCLIPAPGETTVHGVLYFNVSEKDLTRLDLFEGVYYKRRNCSCLLSDGQRTDAAVYLFRERFYHLVDPMPWDPAWFEKEGISLFIDGYKGFG